MGKYKFYIVDVFAVNKYEGNQLAVFRNGSEYSSAEMQKIAREMNYSETTFILSDREKEGGYDVRIFTPAEEIPFAGHPTLGTAFVIQREIIKKKAEAVRLNLKAGQIPVQFTYTNDHPGELWMTQLPPKFGDSYEPGILSQILNVPADHIDDRFPVMAVSTGLPFIIVPLKSLEAVKRCRIRREKYFDFVNEIEAKAILVFAPETYHAGNDLNVRVFVHYYGIPEDPATGSANGCLAGYLARQRYWGDAQIDIRVEQGYEINRPSLLLLKAKDRQNRFLIQVGGRVVMTARGELV